MNWNRFTVMLLVGLGLLPFAVQAKKVTVKFALVAPEGTSWVKAARKSFLAIKKQTGDQVVFKMYAGAKQGEESVVLQKMRINAVHAAGFTSVALSEIVKEYQVLGLPGLYENYKELDYVLAKTRSFYEQKFEEKGFIFLGWAEIGPIYVFTNTPARDHEDFKHVKMWAMPGEPIAPVAMKKFGMSPITVPLTDVLIQLESNALNGFANPPMGALALQWYRRAQYMGHLPLLYSTGGVVMKKKTWDNIKPEHQQLVKTLMWELSKTQTQQMRIENAESIETLKKAGIQIIEYTPESIAITKKSNLELQEYFIDKYYSAELLAQVRNYIQEVRNP
ncbi:TRAP transporter substrate-binding protein DctP [Deltaproteobacteria bacterium TL4]